MSRQDTPKSGSKKDKIILNVGGKRFEPYRSTLMNQPEMPLAWITRNKDKLDYDPETGEFFFDRHPMVFSQILNYFQTGKLHCPRGMCGPCFQDELTFWGIHEQQMETCCWSDYTNYREAQENLKALNFKPKYVDSEHNEEDSVFENPPTDERSRTGDEPLSFWDTYKPIIWEILDEPYSSTIAKVYGWVSLIFVVISIFTAALWTIELFKEQEESSNNGPDSPRLFLLVTEGICTVWFSCEFILRLALCPSLKGFASHYQNWIDLLAIIPAYFIILNVKNLLIDILTSCRILRIFRFLKLLYDLQIIGKTFKASSNLFFILVFVLLIPVLVCSSVLYYTEGNHGDSISRSKFTSIPASLWWGLITVTTVGYGDLSPTSLPGKIFGVFCALCGVLLVAMTASIAGSSFSLYYNLARAQMKLPKKRQSFNIDCENLHTVISYDNRPCLSASPADSCCEHSSSHSEENHVIKDFVLDTKVGLKDNDNDFITVVSPKPEKQLFEENYMLNMVKKTVLPERKS